MAEVSVFVRLDGVVGAGAWDASCAELAVGWVEVAGFGLILRRGLRVSV